MRSASVLIIKSLLELDLETEFDSGGKGIVLGLCFGSFWGYLRFWEKQKGFEFCSLDESYFNGSF